MASEEVMYVPISVEYLLSALFGKLNYHGYVGAVSKRTWKKDLAKTATYIKKSIELNVQTDALHRKQLLSTCDDLLNLVKRAESLNSLNASAIEYLVRLVFLLLGNMPDHWQRRAPYADRFWELNGHRTLQYSQTTEQKVYLLIHAVDIRQQVAVTLEEYPNLHEAFCLGFKGNAEAFLSWFKHRYPSAYCQVF